MRCGRLPLGGVAFGDLSAHPRARTGGGGRHADVPVHRPRAGRAAQPRLSPLRLPDVSILVPADWLAAVPDQSFLGDSRSAYGVADIPDRPTAGMPEDRQRGGGSGHGLRPYLLVAGHHCGGLHTALRHSRGSVACAACLGSYRPTRILFSWLWRLFAAGLGNHTTIVGFAPGIALYALLTHRQFVLRARTLAITTLILFAGLLQYGFIIVRSRQPGAYVESRATTIGELVGVMSGRQFSDRLFAFEWRQVISDRLPWLIGRILAPELTYPGWRWRIVGAAWLLRHRLADGLLIFLGGLARRWVRAELFGRRYARISDPDNLRALGGCRQSARSRRRDSWSDRRWCRHGCGHRRCWCCRPGSWLAISRMTDRSRDTAAAVTFDRLFDAVPDRSAFVHEDFLVDRMVMFKLLGDGSAGRRHIELAPRNANVLQKAT